MNQNFVANLKQGLGSDPQHPWIFLGNFEVEKYWAPGASALPSVSFASSDVIMNRMDEMAVLLASKNDYVVVKGPVDRAAPAWYAGTASPDGVCPCVTGQIVSIG
jgi:hypothetical protein